MSKALFEEFQGVSAKEWKQQIQMDLKGADYNDTLIWQSLEGIHVKPFYNREDLPEDPINIPGQPAQWQVTQHIFVDDIAITKQLIAKAISNGAEALYLSAEKPFDCEQLFHKIQLESITIFGNFGFLDQEFLEKLTRFLKKKGVPFHVNVDPLHQLAKDGNWFQNLEKDHEVLDALVSQNPSEAMLGVHTHLYQNAGANSIQQLAYGLAHANEYLNHFAQQKQLKLTFIVSVGSNYFFEIAKIRALRWLYASLATEYGMPPECTILAIPSKRNKTLYDYNVNMLRTTTECMSAVLGGANAVCNLPYDVLYHKSNEFGERISRNQLLILKSESYFDVVSNPAEGSYYISQLTKELANKALELFKEIEEQGGFMKMLKHGTLQKKIKESSQKEQQWFDEGKLVLVGTNKYPNTEDRMKDELELYPFVKTKPRKTLLEPIVEKRLAETLEQDRLNHE